MVSISQVSVTARLGRRSDSRGNCEHGTPLPLCAVVLLLASAARRFLGVAIALPRGSARSRESLTQDSRSAVKARLFDPLRESFGERRCASRGRRRDGLERPSRGFRALGHAKECRVEAETVALRAYVTSGAPLVTTRAMRDACALRPHATSCGELVARGTRAARRSRAARTAGRRQSQGCGSGEGRRRLRCSAGVAAVQVPTLKAADDAKVPAVLTGTRVKSTRTDNRATSATLRLHRTYRSSVWRTDRYVASGAVASTTGAMTALLSRLEEPGAHVEREHLAIPRGMSSGGALRTTHY